MLKKGKTQLFRDGSPMVYSGAVDRIIGRPPPITGDVVLVADGTEKPIGWGLYNSVSMFCVRLMQLEDEAARYVSNKFSLFCGLLFESASLIVPVLAMLQRSIFCAERGQTT